MVVSERLGSAELELGADLAPLDDDLEKAEKRVATSVAVMQALLDKLELKVRDDGSLGGILTKLSVGAGALAADWAAASDVVRASLGKVDSAIAHTAEATVAASEIQKAAIDSVTAAYLEQAEAARLAGDAGLGRALGADLIGAIAGRGGGGARGRGGAGTSAAEMAALATIFEGVRGRGHIGSRTNPEVVVIAAGSREPLGGYAAAVGEQAASGGGITPGVVPAGSGSQGPVAAATGPSRGTSAVAGGSSTDQRNAAVREAALAAALQKLDGVITGSQTRPAGVSGVVLAGHQRPEPSSSVILPVGVESKGQGSHKAIPVVVTDSDPRASGATGDAVASALAAEAAKSRMPGQFAPTGAADIAALEALGMTAVRSPSGANRVYGIGGVPGTRNYGVSPLAVAAAGGADHGAGGTSSWLSALLWGHAAGGGGGRRLPGYAGALLAGAGGIGAGVGSLGSFAGFGPEHIILTLGGIAGSGAAALGGGALLGAGALGKFAVGAGSDAAVGASTLADTKQLYGAYEAVTKAVRTYGKDSEQAKEATKELNTVFLELGNTAGVKAEAGVAKAAISLNEFWDKQTSGARVQASKIAMQLLELDKAYIPLVAHAAEQNFSVINKTIKPLLDWLKGPEGMGIFLQLESEFKNEIPTAMAALTQGFEFFAKTVAYTAPLTGGFLKDLDTFFTKWNTPSEFSVWEGEMNKLIRDFDVWKAFIHELGGALVDLFDKDAHTGETIIETLTQMLHKVREYENSTAGAAAIRNIFTVHKEEAIALLDALVPLIASFSHIYTTISPPLVHAVTDIAEAFTKVVTAIEKAGALGTWAVGLTLIAWKLKVLVPLLKAAGVETGLLTAEEDKNAVAGGLDAAAQGGLAGTTGLAGGSAYERAMAAQEGSDALAAGGLTAEGGGLAALLSKSNLLKAGIYGAGGLIGGSLLASATGAKGTLASGLQAGGAGAGVGFVLGPAAGALLGTEIAPGLGTALGAGIGFAAPYVVKALTSLFASSTSKAEEAVRASNAQKSSRIIGSLGSALLPPSSSEARRGEVNKALDAASKYAAQRAESGGIATRSLRVDRRAIAAGNARDTAEELREYEKAGAAAMLGFREGFTHGEDPTRFAFVADGLKVLKTFPPQARAVGAKAMIEYAAELEAKKTLPQGAMRSVIQAIEHEFPQLANYIKAQGFETAKGFTAAMKLTEAETNTKTTLHSIEQHFDLMGLNVGTAMKDLEYIIAHTTGEQNKIAKEKLSELTYDNAHQWDAMTAKVKQSAHEQATAIHNLSTELPILGAPGYEKYVGLVQKWAEGLSERVTAGVESLHTGISQINKMLEGELSALGAPKEIAANLITGKGGINLRGGLGKGVPLEEGQPVPGAAQGALFQIGAPGAGGRDTVGLNVGGLPIAVGAGEQVAVFNRHQQPIVNAALAAAGYGGLPGLFNAVSTPNYMASGGLIPDVVQAGLADVRKAGHAKVASSHGTGGGGSLGGASFSGSWVQVMRGIAKEEGWSLPAWEGVISLESGGRVSAQNPKSTAFGLGQLESMNWPVYGGAPGSSGVEQIMAMARYIKATYRNPTAALAHEHVDHWYSPGGLLAFASGGLLGSGASKRASTDLQRIWEAAAPYFHRSPHSPMPTTEIVRNGEAGGLLGTTMESPSGPHWVPVGKRATYIEKGFLNELGINKGNPLGLSAVLFEWIHHFQRQQPAEAADGTPEGRALQKRLGWSPATEGGAQAWLEMFGPRIFAAAGFPWPPAADGGLFGPAAKWAQQKLGAKWVEGTQFGFAKGGLVPGFASGGLLGFSGGTADVAKAKKPDPGRHKTAKAAPEVVQAWRLHPFAHIPSLEQLPEEYQQRLLQLNSLMGTGLPRLEEEYGLESERDEFLLSGAPHGGEFIITPTATEKLTGITLPWEDTSNVGLRRSQLEGLRGSQQGIYSQLKSALGLIDPVTAETVKVIGERKKAIEAIRAKIKKLREELAAKLKKLRDEIKANLKQITTLEHTLTSVGDPTKANAAERAKLKDEINKLKGDNKNKGGDETEIGTGGQIASESKSTESEIKKLEGNSAVLHSQQKELEERHTLMSTDYTAIVGVSGKGGSLGTAHLKVEELNQQIAELGGTPAKLQEAILEAGGGPESALELKERNFAQKEEQLKISREETKIYAQALSVFSAPGDIGTGGATAFSAAAARGLFLPFGGSYESGGVVPGPIGKPIAVVAHGGEEYLGADGQRGERVQIIQNINTLTPGDPAMLRAVGDAATRGQRLQGTRRPSRIVAGV